MPDRKIPLTVNWTAEEIAAIQVLGRKKELTHEGVLRQALRLYQMVEKRRDDGETMSFSGDEKRLSDFAGPGPGESAT